MPVGILSDLEMQAKRGNPHRAALLVVGRIRSMLQIEAGEEARKQPRAVIRSPRSYSGPYSRRPSPIRKSWPPSARYCAWTPEIPLAVNSVATVSKGLCQRVPLTEMPPVANRSIAVNAKLSVFPSFQPSRENTPMSFVISCSMFSPKPYLSVPLRRVASTSGTPPVGFRQADRRRHRSRRRHDSRRSARGWRRRVSSLNQRRSHLDHIAAIDQQSAVEAANPFAT